MISIRVLFYLIFFQSFITLIASAQDARFPQFTVPDHDLQIDAINELHLLHHAAAFSDCTLWDPWLPHATLWTGRKPRDQYRASLLNRKIDSEGYVSVNQHRGMAHSEGWPFPAWQQSGSAGFHFSIADEVMAIQHFSQQAITNTDGWNIRGAVVEGIDPLRGLRLKATSDVVTITTPAFGCGTIVAPFARLEWAASGLGKESQPNIQWQFESESEWKEERHVAFPPLREADGQQFANVPLYRHPQYAGLLTRYRVTFNHAMGSIIDLKSIITAIDTRHPITNANFVRGSTEYFAWTRDVDFLRKNIGRMRRALRFALSEFQIRDRKLVHVPWVGHDGRSGLVAGPNGSPLPRLGLGVGNNYYDLVPFGGDDALATIYYFDALNLMADIEREVAAQPAWNIPTDEPPFSVDELTSLADAVKAQAGQYFWNETTERFIGWQDTEGVRYDYGFVFVNNEAVAYGFATPQQARQVYDWLDGNRIVDGDTSQGADIYHWRFAPRVTTRRNTQDYVWAWSAPQSISWGDQIQDGGAVLGFSFYDLMARLQTKGADDAWKRLQEILTWFRQVQSEGGYRTYYSKPGRGVLQGGGPPGGLGMDQEFMESVLVPQVMLYGFLGCKATANGLHLNPQLPTVWPELTVTNIHYSDHVLDVTATSKTLRLTSRLAGPDSIELWLKPSSWSMTTVDANGTITCEEEMVGSVTPLRFKPTNGQTYILKDKTKQ
ncbi:MAG: glycosyl hydrolase family 65 protein [Aureliella sp.]